MLKKKISYILCLFFFFCASCTSVNDRKVENKLQIPLITMYSEAIQKYESGDYNDSIKIFEKVEKDYPYSDWASKSLLMRSYIYYEVGNYIYALNNLQRYKKKYSGNKDIVYAEYLIALCLYEQINIPALTQENTELALKQFQKIISNYPTSEYAIDSKFKIDLIYEQLAAKEMYLARYYSKRKIWGPAIYRLNNVIKNYQKTIFIEEALHRLVQIHYSLGNVSFARKYAAILGYNYNDSDWYKKSYNMLEGQNIPLQKIKEKKNLKEKIMQLIKIK